MGKALVGAGPAPPDDPLVGGWGVAADGCHETLQCSWLRFCKLRTPAIAIPATMVMAISNRAMLGCSSRRSMGVFRERFYHIEQLQY